MCRLVSAKGSAGTQQELPVPVEQDSCAAACVLQGAVPACGHWGCFGAYAGAQCIIRGHKHGGCLCLPSQTLP